MKSTKSIKPLQILLVEDSDSDAVLLQESILSSGATDISISVVQSLNEAKEHLKNNHPAAVLLDLTLPDSSGLDTVREARRISPDLPIVVLTGVDDENMGVEAMRTGVQDYLVKGQTDGRTITRVIRYSIERKQAESALQATMQRFYVVLSSMYSAVLLVTDEGRVEFTNQALCDQFGLEGAPADLVGLDSRDMVEKIKNAYLHPDKAVARIREILDRGQPVKSEELAMQDGRTCLRDFVPLNVQGKPFGRLWLHFDITERKRAEEALRKAHDELDMRVKERTAELSRVNKDLSAEIAERKLAQERIIADQKQLRLLTAELLLTEERERHEIATALHDSIGPILAFSKRELGTLQKSAPPHIAESLKNVSDNISQAVKQTRTLTFDLSPPTLYTLGFEIATEELLERFCQEHKLEYSFQNSDVPKPLTDPVKVLLYRSIRETLINIAKHARAKLVRVVLSRVKNDIEITIEDDGKGFDTSALKEKTTGLGLFSVRERLRHIGGKLEIESKRGKGTHITLTAPLKIG